MSQEVEIDSFDLRYESYRMKKPEVEKALIVSIVEHGIRDPLQGVDAKGVRILLNGFKRYRCARRLGIGMVPYASLGEDEAFGIIELLRIANSRSLDMLEQARLIDELRNGHNMRVSDIARLLERATSWVSMRIGIIEAMSPTVREALFEGKFPVYSYLYTLRRFIRMKTVTRQEVDEFVRLVSGKHLSIRDIELLAQGYFHGPSEMREQIKAGDIGWGLSRLREGRRPAEGCSELEVKMLRDLETTLSVMQRVQYRSKDDRYKSDAFYAQATILIENILKQMEPFSRALRLIYDRAGQTQGHRCAS